MKARTDGRGAVRPFGSYNWKEWGATVKIGSITKKVSQDGRFYIPKSIMDKYGRTIKGRKCIAIDFSTKKGTAGFDVATRVFKLTKPIVRKTGQRIEVWNVTKEVTDKKGYVKRVYNVLDPTDISEYSWSP